MGVRLQSVYYTEKNNAAVLNLWDSAFSGATTSFKAERLEISWRGDDAQERFSPVIGSELRLSMIVDSAGLETFITDLVGAEEGRFTVSFGAFIGYGNTFAWNGYITTDNVRIEDTQLDIGYRVEIRAVDGIGRLKEIDYNNAGTAYTGKETFIEHVLNCLNKLDFVSDLYPAPTTILNVVANWHEDSWTYASTINPLNRSRVSHGAFYYRDTKGNNVYSSCHKVLEEICKAWGARLMFSGSAFWLMQVNEMATPTAKTVFRYDTTGAETVAASQDLSIVHTPNVAGNKILRFAGGAFEFFLPLKSVQVDYKHIQTRNLLAGYTWTDSTSQTVSVEDIDDNDNTAQLSYTGKLSLVARHREFVDDFAPYRIRFRFRIVVAGVSYHRPGTINANGGFYYTPDDWNPTPTGYYYEVYTNPIQNKTERITLNLSILTIPLESSGTLLFEFDQSNAYYAADGSAVDSGDLDLSWELVDNYLEYLGAGTFESQSDIYRFKSTNDAAASKKDELVTVIGDGPNLNSPGHIEVYNDASAWVLSDAWRVGNSGTYKAHSQLLVNEIIKGQLTPVKKFSGMTFQNLGSPTLPLFPHLAISYESAYWLFLSGTFNVKNEFFSGDWFKLQSASGYTESTVEFVPKDSASGPPSSGSSGGTGTTGSNPTNTSGGANTISVSQFRQVFEAQSTDTLTVTENGGTLPSVPAHLQVLMYGQELLPSQYTVTGSDIVIGADTHISGANYVVKFTIIQ